MKLFFDTETTGKADFRAPADAAHQPRIVQLGAMLTDDSGIELSSLSLIIRPDGFEIPIEASNIHGITNELAKSAGVNIKHALRLFCQLWEASDVAICHNTEFDFLVLDGEMYRLLGSEKSWGKQLESFCTMRAMTSVCKLPGQYGDFKWPKLQEAYTHAFGKEFDGAHDAMADVRACAAVYFWLANTKPEVVA